MIFRIVSNVVTQFTTTEKFVDKLFLVCILPVFSNHQHIYYFNIDVLMFIFRTFTR